MPGAANPGNNGLALINAIAALSPAPSATVNWTVLLDPGTYDLGTATLPGAFLTIVGAGDDNTGTTIRSTGAGPTIDYAGDGELRHLYLQRNGTASGAVISNSAFARIVIKQCTVAPVAGSQSPDAVGINLSPTGPTALLTLEDSSINPSGSNLATSVIGVNFNPGSGGEIRNTDFFSSGSQVPSAVMIRAATSSGSFVRLRNVDLWMLPNSGTMIGLQWASGPLDVIGLNITAENPSNLVRGIQVPATNTTIATGFLNDVHILTTSGTNTSTGIIQSSATARLQLHGATVHGLGTSLAQTAGFVKVTHSVLADSVIRTAGTLRCGLVTDADGNAVTCP